MNLIRNFVYSIIASFLLIIPRPLLATNSSSCNTLFSAIRESSFETVFLLLSNLKRTHLKEMGTCVDEDGNNAFHIAARFAKRMEIFDAIYYLLYVDINSTNDGRQTPLIVAALHSNIKAAHFLLRREHSPHARMGRRDRLGNTALHYAAMNKNSRLLRRLIYAKWFSPSLLHIINRNNETPLDIMITQLGITPLLSSEKKEPKRATTDGVCNCAVKEDKPKKVKSSDSNKRVTFAPGTNFEPRQRQKVIIQEPRSTLPKAALRMGKKLIQAFSFIWSEGHMIGEFN